MFYTRKKGENIGQNKFIPEKKRVTTQIISSEKKLEGLNEIRMCSVENLPAVKRPHSFLQPLPRDSETGPPT